MKKLLNQHDPILRQIADPLKMDDIKTLWLKDLVHVLLDVMKQKGALGIAAPQIGINKRVILFSSNYTKRRNLEINFPDTILINPTMKILSDKRNLGYEGCLNCEDLMGEVSRAEDIEYAGYDLDANYIKKQVTGMEARVVQHEIDHLNGVLFLDHVQDKNSIITYEKYVERLAKC